MLERFREHFRCQNIRTEQKVLLDSTVLEPSTPTSCTASGSLLVLVPPQSFLNPPSLPLLVPAGQTAEPHAWGMAFTNATVLFLPYQVVERPCWIKGDLGSIWRLSFQGHQIPLVFVERHSYCRMFFTFYWPGTPWFICSDSFHTTVSSERSQHPYWHSIEALVTILSWWKGLMHHEYEYHYSNASGRCQR